MHRIAALAGSLALLLTGCGPMTTTGEARVSETSAAATTSDPATSVVGTSQPAASTTPAGTTSSGAVPSLDPSPCDGPPFIDPGARNGGRPAPPRFSRQKLPAGFRPVLLVTCTQEERTTPADGQWTYVVEQDATDGLDAVVAALRATPSPPPTGGVMCVLSLVSDPYFLLVDASGTVVLPEVPHERACNRPMDVGLSTLHFTEKHAFKVYQQATPAELATSCSHKWKNEPKMFAHDGGTKPLDSPLVGFLPTTVCVYGPSAEDPDVGSFSGGTALGAAHGRSLADSLARVSVGRSTCDAKPSDTFAVVTTGKADWLYVELDGCRRVLTNDGTRYSDPAPALVELIKGLTLQR
jgi:hypothetical protein